MADEQHRSDVNPDRGDADRRGETRSAAQTEEPMTGTRSARDVTPTRKEPVESPRTSRQMDYWPEMSDFRQRFDDLQGEFIEEPREAVRKAEKLVEEAMSRMTSTMNERLQRMRSDAENGDTENLRQAMRTMRDFIDSLGSRRAA